MVERNFRQIWTKILVNYLISSSTYTVTTLLLWLELLQVLGTQVVDICGPAICQIKTATVPRISVQLICRPRKYAYYGGTYEEQNEWRKHFFQRLWKWQEDNETAHLFLQSLQGMTGRMGRDTHMDQFEGPFPPFCVFPSPSCGLEWCKQSNFHQNIKLLGSYFIPLILYEWHF